MSRSSRLAQTSLRCVFVHSRTSKPNDLDAVLDGSDLRSVSARLHTIASTALGVERRANDLVLSLSRWRA